MVGYESGNEQILKNIRKGVSVERARRFTRDCHELGILIHGTFILGLPGETRDTIQETMRFACEMQPETLQVSLASPYPGTAFYDFVTKNNYLTVDSLVDETGYQKCTVSYPEVSADEIFKAVETFYRRYYFTPRYIWKSVKKMASSREEAKRLLGEGVQFIGSMAKRRRIANGRPSSRLAVARSPAVIAARMSDERTSRPSSANGGTTTTSNPFCRPSSASVRGVPPRLRPNAASGVMRNPAIAHRSEMPPTNASYGVWRRASSKCSTITVSTPASARRVRRSPGSMSSGGACPRRTASGCASNVTTVGRAARARASRTR